MKYKKSPFEKHISSLMSLRANHLISCQGEQRWLAAPKTPANHSPLLSNIKLNQIILPQGTHAQEGEGVLWNTEMYQHNFHGLVFDKISVRLHLSSPHFSQLLGKRLTRVSSYGRHLNGRGVFCVYANSSELTTYKTASKAPP